MDELKKQSEPLPKSLRKRFLEWLILRKVWVIGIILLALCINALTPKESWGRAGGGRSFSGGFRSGGGSFRSSGRSWNSGGSRHWGGSGWNTGRTISPRYANDDLHPLELIVVLLILAVVIIGFAYLKRLELVTPPEAKRRRRVDETQNFVNRLRQTDSHFDWQAFVNRFELAFRKIQDAWQNQDLHEIRPFVSDHLFERFVLQIQEQRDLGYKEQLTAIQILRVELVEAETVSVFDVVTVAVTASMKEARISLKDQKVIESDSDAESFVEYWSLVRRRGAATVTGNGLVEGVCPVCGDSLKLNRFGQCQSCNTLSRNGEYDWVLAEITQESVWRPHVYQSANKFAWYVEDYDPGFNIQHLEDRASVIFWRKAMADRLVDSKPLFKVATDAFCETYQQHRLATGQQSYQYEGNCSVGSVELVGFVLEEHQHLALVEVQYSCHDFERTPTGEVKDLGRWQRKNAFLVLARNAGVISDLRSTLASTACPNCGAPESKLESHACEYCDTVLNDGSREWVLTAWHASSDTEAHTLRQAAQRGRVRKYRTPVPQPSYNPSASSAQAIRHSSPLDGLSWLVETAMADEALDPSERDFLQSYADRVGIDTSILETMIQDAHGGKLKLARPPDRATAKVWLGDIAELAMLDHEVTDTEVRILKKLGKQANLSIADINLILAKRFRSRNV